MLRRLLLAVLLGVVTTVLVPRVTRWCARAGLLPPGAVEAADALGGVISRTTDADMTVITWSGVSGGGSVAIPPVDQVREAATDELFALASTSAVASVWTTISPSSPTPAAYVTVEIVEQGFPFRCTQGWTTTLMPGTPSMRTRVSSTGFISVPVGPLTYRLTVLPIWEGLLGNIAIYGAVWFGVMWASVARRNHGRIRRRLCTACGYDLRSTPPGKPCPECGVHRGSWSPPPESAPRTPTRP